MLGDMEHCYVLFGILISHSEKKEGSWLLSIGMNSNMQTPERNAVTQMQDWKQQITVLLAKRDLVQLRQCDQEQHCSRGGTNLDDRNAAWNLEAASGKYIQQKTNAILNSRDTTYETNVYCLLFTRLLPSRLKYWFQFHLDSRKTTRGFTKEQKTDREIICYDLNSKMSKIPNRWSCYWLS